jgi:hypothetical protein
METEATISVTDELSKRSTSSIKTDDDDDDWITQSANNLDVTPGATKASEEPTPTTKGEWSEMDFPPLVKAKGQTKAEHSVWGEKISSKQTSPRSNSLASRELF